MSAVLKEGHRDHVKGKSGPGRRSRRETALRMAELAETVRHRMENPPTLLDHVFAAVAGAVGAFPVSGALLLVGSALCDSPPSESLLVAATNAVGGPTALFGVLAGSWLIGTGMAAAYPRELPLGSAFKGACVGAALTVATALTLSPPSFPRLESWINASSQPAEGEKRIEQVSLGIPGLDPVLERRILRQRFAPDPRP